MKRTLVVLGILACFIGLVWFGQGTGHFPYPARSFMIGQTQWAHRGAALFLVGALLVWAGRRR